MEHIRSVLTLAGLAASSTGNAVSVVGQIKELLTKGGEQISAEQDDLLNALAGQLTSANMMNVQLSTLLKEIQRDWQREDIFERKRARYEMFTTPMNDVLFRLKADHADGEQDHFICPICLGRDQVFSFVTGKGSYRNCQSCKHAFSFDPPPTRRRSVNVC
jgi:hypothetical protein